MSLKDKFYNFEILFMLLYLSSTTYAGFLGPLREKLGIMPLIVLVVIFVLIVLREKGIRYFVNKYNIVGLLIVIIGSTPYLFFNAPSYTIIYFYYPALLVLVVNISNFMKDYNLNKTNELISRILLFELLITTIVSLFWEFSLDTQILRQSVPNTKEELKIMFNMKTTYMLGGFGTAYVCPMVTILLLDKVKRNKLCYIAIFVCILLIFESQFFLNIIGFIISIIIYFSLLMIERGKTKKNFLVILSLMVVFVTLGFLVMYHIDLLPKLIEGKIDSIFSFIKGERTTIKEYIALSEYQHTNMHKLNIKLKGSLEHRIAVYFYPVYGLIKNKFMFNPKDVWVINHTFILDFLSFYGILLFPLFLYLIIVAIRNARENMSNKKTFYSILTFLIFESLLNSFDCIEFLIFIAIIMRFFENENSKE